jgi:hypothetical protein
VKELFPPVNPEAIMQEKDLYLAADKLIYQQHLIVFNPNLRKRLTKESFERLKTSWQEDRGTLLEEFKKFYFAPWTMETQ